MLVCKAWIKEGVEKVQGMLKNLPKWEAVHAGKWYILSFNLEILEAWKSIV